MSKVIRPMRFVKVANDELHDDGYPKGTYFFVAGLNPSIIPGEEDPYLRRLLAYVNHLNDEGEVDVDNIIVCDPRNLEPLSKTEEKKLKRKFERQMDQAEVKNEKENETVQ